MYAARHLLSGKSCENLLEIDLHISRCRVSISASLDFSFSSESACSSISSICTYVFVRRINVKIIRCSERDNLISQILKLLNRFSYLLLSNTLCSEYQLNRTFCWPKWMICVIQICYVLIFSCISQGLIFIWKAFVLSYNCVIKFSLLVFSHLTHLCAS